MSTGSCLCGAIKYSLTGESALKVPTCLQSPNAPANMDQAICHCDSCKKTSGSLFSAVIVIPESAFTLVSGTPKTFVKKDTASGNPATDFFCPTCASILWTETPGVPGTKIVKAGTLDTIEAVNAASPVVEFFAPKRAAWLLKFPDTEEKVTME